MTAKVDPDLCTGCELCTELCPNVYTMDGDVAKVKADPIPAGEEECAQDAAEQCPVEAISVQ